MFPTYDKDDLMCLQLWDPGIGVVHEYVKELNESGTQVASFWDKTSQKLIKVFHRSFTVYFVIQKSEG